ncbi:MBG domain-containing protein [beta proteobacterium MWH-UniP1]
MNRSFRCIWSRVHHCIVVVAETVRAHGKEKSSVRLVSRSVVVDSEDAQQQINAPPNLKVFARLMAASGLLSFLPFIAHAAPDVNQLPTNGQVVAGQASINSGGAVNAPVMTINQSTNRAVINWSGHDIGANAQVNYVVPSASSATLSRVTSGNPTQIFGRLTSNGQLFLTNPSGILFGRTASVDVGGLVATTHSIGNEDFMAGKLRFTRDGATGSVVNEGQIKAALNGYIALLAPEVRNEGVIVAQMGTVALAAGEAFELNINDKSLAGIRVEPATIKTLVENKHAVHAPGGLIILSSRAQSEILGGVVKQSGELIASSITERGGRILLEGDDITLTATSKIEAKGATGGGEVLVGGGWQGKGDMHQATTVAMAEGATIDASALDTGSGGTVVLWSDVRNPNSITAAHGSIFAKGGVNGGDGGQIETSGRQLHYDGISVSTLAADGTAGNWLLDPYNFFLGSSELSTLNSSLLSNNVTISTASSSGGGSDGVLAGTSIAGHIVFFDNFSYTGSNARTLTLTADKDIWIKGNITADGSGSLGLTFNASGDRVLLNGDITTKGGAITFNTGTVHLQKTSGTQSVTTGGGSLDFGSSNIQLLRQSGNGSVALNTGSGALTLGTGSLGYTTTFHDIHTSFLLSGWGGAHTNGSKTYGINVVSGREYSTRLYFWDSWDNERGELVVVDGASWYYYFTAHRTHGGGGNELSNIVANYGTQYQITGPSALGRSSWNDVYVDVTFLAQHNGTLTTWTNTNQDINDESLELHRVRETYTSSTGYTNGGRSLSLTTTSGQITGSKSISGISALSVTTSNGSSSLSGTISGSGTTLTKAGTGTFALTANNTYTGTTTINDGALVLRNDAPNPSSKTFTGTGRLVIEPSSASFSSTFTNSGWSFDSGLGSVTIGKSGNSSEIIIENAISIAGPISIYGGNASLSANLTSTASSGTSISIVGQKITQAAGVSVTTSGGNIEYSAAGGAFTTGVDNAIKVGALSGSRAVIDAGGGNITLSGAFGSSGDPGTGTNDFALWLFGTDLKTSGVGNISITGDAANTTSTASVYGVNLGGGTLVRTETGAISITGTGGKVSTNARGVVVDGHSVKVLSASGAITLTDKQAAGSTGIYNGFYLKPSVSADIFLGSDGTTPLLGSFTSSSSNIKIQADKLTFEANGSYKTKVNTTGTLTVESVSNSFAAALTWPLSNLNFGSTLSGLKIGKSTNTANITLGSSQTVNGLVNIYGGNVELSAAITTTNTSTGDISIFTSGLTGSGGITLANGRSFTVTQSGNSTYSGLISGTNASVVKAGAGSLGLSNLGNTYSGGTTISAGKVSVADAGTLGTGSITFNGGGLVATGSSAFDLTNAIALSAAATIESTNTGGVTFSGGITNGSHLLTVNTDQAITLSGNIVGLAGGLIKSGTGTLLVSGTNTYTGGTTVSAGTLKLGSATALGGAAGAVTVNNGAVLDLNGQTVANTNPLTIRGTGVNSGGALINSSATPASYAGLLTLSATSSIVGGTGAINLTNVGTITGSGFGLTLGGSQGGSIASIIGTGTGTVTKVDAGTWLLTGASTNAGATYVNAGALQVGDGGTSGALGAGSVSIADGASLVFNRLDEFTVSNVISSVASGEKGSLVKEGSGTLILSGNSPGHYGKTQVKAGTLKLGSGSALGVSAVTVGTSDTSTASLDLNNYNTGSQNVSITLYGYGTGGQGGGVGALTNSNTAYVGNGYKVDGLVTLGSNTYIGGAGHIEINRAIGGGYALTKVGAGRLYFGENNTYSGGTVIVAGELHLGTNSSDYKAGTLGIGDVINNGLLQVNRADNITIANNISGSGGFTKYGSGSLTLTGNNSYAGLTDVYKGELIVGDGKTAGTLGSGSVRLSPFDKTVSSKLVFNRSDDLVIANTINGTEGGSLEQRGSGKITLTKTNAYGGTTTISAGALQIGNGGSTGTLGKGAVTNNGTLIFNRSDSVSIANVISGIGALTKEGSGTFTLTANQTYSGATSINAGVLVLSNNAPASNTSGFSGAGTLRIEPTDGDFTSDFSNSGWVFGATLGGLTIGKATSANGTSDKKVTIASAILIAGSVTVYGGDIAVNAALTSTTGNLNLHATGSVTQTAAITASGLGLQGSGSFTLTNSSNNVATIAAGSSTARIGALSFADASGGLTIGTVNPTGIYSSGDVFIQTLSGNLTIAENINTTSTTSTAIRVAAGTSAARGGTGTPASGNIIVNGSPVLSAGTGGTIGLYTGSISDSTGLTALIGSASGNFRYNTSINSSGTVTAGYSTALATNQVNALYREQPTATITVAGKSMTYGDSLPTLTSTVSTLQNGDKAENMIGDSTLSVTAGVAGTSTSGNFNYGTHSIGVASAVDKLGYSLSYTPGTLTVGKRAVSVSGVSAADKPYDGSDSATLSYANLSFGNSIAGDLLTITAGSGKFDNKNAGENKTVSLTNFSYGGADLGNYTVTDQPSVMANITKRVVSLSAVKTYDGSNSLTGSQVTIGNLVGSEKLTYTGATSSSKHVAAAGKYIDAITLGDATDGSGGLESNYQLPTLNVANAPVTITAKTLTPTISNTGVTKVYDGTTAAPDGFTPTYTFSGLITDDTAAVLTNTGAAYNSATVAGANQITVSGLAIGSITGTNSSQATDYVLDATSKTVAATISRATLTVTADNKSRVYGDANPIFSQTITGYVNGENKTSAGVTGSATGSTVATSTSDVGSYTITGSTGNLAAANYSFSTADGTLSIGQRAITLTASNQSKTYGDALVLGTSAFSLTSGSFATGELATSATLSAANGYAASTTQGVGTYANEIQIAGATGTGGFNASNYSITYTPGSLTINARPVTVTAVAKTKVYGETDPSLTYNVAADGVGTSRGLANSETLTGALARSAGENVGSYAIGQGTLINSNNSNYAISYVADNLSVTARPITLKASNQSKTYGDALVLGTSAFSLTSGSFATGELATSATLSAANGYAASTTQGVGTYANEIQIAGATGTGGFNASNYSITYTPGSLTINARPVTVTAVAKTKVYGETDPSLTYSVAADGVGTSRGLANSETLTGALARSAGENVGNYAIGQGTLINSNNSNYAITYVGNALTITPRTVTLSATKTYDGSTSLTGSQVTIGTGVGSETLTYTNASANSKHVAGADGNTTTADNFIAAITLANGSNGGLAGNYQLPTLNATNAPVTITAKTLTPTVSNTGVTKVYDGTTAAPTGFTPTYTFSGLITDDTAAVLTNTGAAYNSATVAGANQITVSGLAIGSITGTNSSQATDYVLDATSKTVAATISRASLTVTADNKSRVYGDANPTFSQTITGYVNGENATSANVTGSATGSSAATATSNVGSYTITGSTGNLAAANYSFTAADGALTVNQRPITVTAAAKTKIYGETDPSLTYSVAADGVGTSRGLANGETLTGALARSAGENVGNYAIGQGTLTNSNNSNYAITYVGDNLSVTARPITVTAVAKTKVYGETDPLLTYTLEAAGTSRGLVNGDTFTGSLARAAGENVGSYAIGQGTVANSNYAITYVADNLSVTARPITLTASNQSKTYGDALVLGTSAFSLTSGSYATGELATSATLSAANGYAASTTQGVGTYANEIQIAGATGTGGFNASNYSITYTPGNLTINARPVTVTAVAKTKVYGETDPSLTYSVSADGVGTSRGLANGETLTGALSRSAGENVGNYAIGQGTLTNSNNSNYAITYVGDNLSVTARPITLKASNQSKTYGDGLVLGTTAFSLTSGSYATGELATSATLSAANGYAASTTQGVGTYANEIQIAGATGTGGFNASNYSITYTPGKPLMPARSRSQQSPKPRFMVRLTRL